MWLACSITFHSQNVTIWYFGNGYFDFGYLDEGYFDIGYLAKGYFNENPVHIQICNSGSHALSVFTLKMFCPFLVFLHLCYHRFVWHCYKRPVNLSQRLFIRNIPCETHRGTQRSREEKKHFHFSSQVNTLMWSNLCDI